MKNIKFITLITSTIILTLLSNKILGAERLAVNSLAEQFTNEQIVEILDIKERWQWLGYVIIPILLLLKVSIVAIIIDAGCFFFDKEIKYKRLFNIVVKAEFIFLSVIILKTVWFYFFQQNYTLEDLQYFYPLSALNIVGYKGLDVWWIYPFQVINVFELAYWLVLTYGISKAVQIKTEKGLQIVASSYGVGLLIWVVGVMFFTLNAS